VALISGHGVYVYEGLMTAVLLESLFMFVYYTLHSLKKLAIKQSKVQRMLKWADRNTYIVQIHKCTNLSNYIFR